MDVVQIIEAMGSALLAFLIFSAVMQVLFSYALQVISEKNELPGFAAFLAWIPLLNLYPMIRAGGGDFKKFVFGIIGSVVLVGASIAFAASSETGGVIAAIAMIGVALAMFVYMVRIVMNTAARRGLSKGVGLLTFVPVANFLVYPYIAFYDGFKAPHKIGLVIGLLLAFGPLPGQMKMMDQLKATAMEFQDQTNGTLMAASDGAPQFDFGMGGLSAAMEAGAQLAMLEGMDPNDPEQARMMKNEIAEIQNKLAANEASMGADAAAQLQTLLRQQQGRLRSAGPDTPTPPADSDVAETPVGDRTGRSLPAALAPETPPLTASIGRDGDNGYATPASPACPAGTALRGESPPAGIKQWCEHTGSNAGIKHGWLTKWHENGEMAAAGEYQNGLRVGIWTRWHANGEKRVQAEFAEGLQDGALIAWDVDGRKVHEESFVAGAPASR